MSAGAHRSAANATATQLHARSARVTIVFASARTRAALELEPALAVGVDRAEVGRAEVDASARSVVDTANVATGAGELLERVEVVVLLVEDERVDELPLPEPPPLGGGGFASAALMSMPMPHGICSLVSGCVRSVGGVTSPVELTMAKRVVQALVSVAGVENW